MCPQCCRRRIGDTGRPWSPAESPAAARQRIAGTGQGSWGSDYFSIGPPESNVPDTGRGGNGRRDHEMAVITRSILNPVQAGPPRGPGYAAAGAGMLISPGTRHPPLPRMTWRREPGQDIWDRRIADAPEAATCIFGGQIPSVRVVRRCREGGWGTVRRRGETRFTPVARCLRRTRGIRMAECLEKEGGTARRSFQPNATRSCCGGQPIRHCPRGGPNSAGSTPST